MNTTIRSRFWLMAGLVFGAAALRLLPHPPNFTPVAAIALFGGAHFSRKFWAFAVPLAAMLVSDAVMEVTTGHGFTSGMPVIYATFAAIVGMGILIRNRRTQLLPVAGAAVASAVLFYLTTNFAVSAAPVVLRRRSRGARRLLRRGDSFLRTDARKRSFLLRRPLRRLRLGRAPVPESLSGRRLIA